MHPTSPIWSSPAPNPSMRRTNSPGTSGSRRADEAQRVKLREQAPDLTDLVAEERMSLNEAIAAARARREEEQRQRRVATQPLCETVVTLVQICRGGDTAARYDPDLAAPGSGG